MQSRLETKPILSRLLESFQVALLYILVAYRQVVPIKSSTLDLNEIAAVK